MGDLSKMSKWIILIATLTLFHHQILAEEECGSGFTCVFDQRIVAYGCAPLSNLSATACCSIGQGCNQDGQQECGKWCVDCSRSTDPCHLKPGQLPYCPANGASG